VRGGAADGLHDPGREVREVASHPIGARRGAVVQPGHLVERGPLVVLVVVRLEVGPGLEDDAVDAAAGELVRDRAAAGS
jgi:hypothetical protein